MKDSEIIEYLKTIENNYPVNEWVILERHIWPLVKMIISGVLSAKDVDSKHSIKGQIFNYLSKVGHYKNVLSRCVLDNEYADIMIFHHSINRCLLLDDKTEFDIHLDPFTLLLDGEHKICSIEYVATGGKKNIFGSSTKVDGVIERAQLQSKFIRHIDEKNISLYKYDIFLNECDGYLRNKLSVHKIYQTIIYMNCIALFFSNVIRKKKIKFVITESGYGTDVAALFMACKDVGVKCMEVQHGLAAGNGHRWYSSWTKMPNDETRYEMLPDIYWCWSHEDEAVLNSWATGRHIVYVGGKPVYSVMNELEVLTKGNSFRPEKKLPNILFTLQPEVNYPEWLVEVIKDTCNDYNWIIRKHPLFDSCQAKLLDRISNISNVYIDGISSIMLEKLLMCADVHITNHSTVAIDALEFNVKSIIIDKDYDDCFKKQVDDADLFVGDNAVKFIKILKTLIVHDTNYVKKRKNNKNTILKFIKQYIR